ncbi:MAG: sugar phosphate isomerase/epimerase [Rhodobacteraceae bacterium]|nr:sugar phosphate isomerase/epimerase [Paracoccaceae bacterium]
MKYSISNIAWAPGDADRIYDRLAGAGITGLEIAPGLFFPAADDPFAVDQAACDAARKSLASHGLRLTSMQSLLFGAKDASLFGNAAERRGFHEATARAIALGGRLGGLNLVFGSPANRRIPDGMSAAAAREIWQPALTDLGGLAQKAGSILALETNPEGYGTNFMTTLAETRRIAETLDHPGIGINLDLGALIMTGEIETLGDWLPETLPLISHVHLSAPNLAPIAGEALHVRRLVAALGQGGYERWCSVEMRAAPGALDGALDGALELIGALDG